jgi:hypothetical protein
MMDVVVHPATGLEYAKGFLIGIEVRAVVHVL